MSSDRSKRSRRPGATSEVSSAPSASINDDRATGSAEPSRPSLDALPRPPASPRNWDDLPGIRKKPSLAPPTPPLSEAPPAPTVHELFDVSTDDAEYERDKARQRVLARESLRPHPPRPSQTPDPPRLPTPLSWTAAKDPEAPATESEAVEEAADDLLEPAPDSLPEIPMLVSAEPLASVIPTGSVLVPTGQRKSERRFGTARIAAVAAVGLVGVGTLLLTGRAQEGSSSNQASFPLAPPNDEPLPKTTPPLAPPKSVHDLELGVPLAEPSASAAPSSASPAVDPASIPPVAPSGVLPTRPKGPAGTEALPFDSEAATAALSQAALAAMACRKEGDPTGSATVIVRYAPSGRVTSATVEAGPFAGTLTGGCVATTFRKAWIPAFTGDYVTVKKTVALK